MESEEETAICSHCNKEVAKSNLPMHEVHCKRFLCLCPDCKEQVPKDQLEDHRQEAHTLVKCQKCNMKMERCKLSDHEANECPMRLQTCEYCQLDLPSSDLKEHVIACGSRTERCQECNQYIMLKDQLQHAKLCTADDFTAKPSGKHFNPLFANILQEDGFDDFLEDDSRDEFKSKDTILSLSDLQKKKQQDNKIGYSDPDQISTCPYCHLLLPVKTLTWHEDKCRIFNGLRMSEVMDASGKK